MLLGAIREKQRGDAFPLANQEESFEYSVPGHLPASRSSSQHPLQCPSGVDELSRGHTQPLDPSGVTSALPDAPPVPSAVDGGLSSSVPRVVIRTPTCCTDSSLCKPLTLVPRRGTRDGRTGAPRALPPAQVSRPDSCSLFPG